MEALIPGVYLWGLLCTCQQLLLCLLMSHRTCERKPPCLSELGDFEVGALVAKCEGWDTVSGKHICRES